MKYPVIYEERRHRYSHPETGGTINNVSTILKPYYSAKYGARNEDEPPTIYMQRGTFNHTVVEEYELTGLLPANPDTFALVENIAKKWDKFRAEITGKVILSEKPLAYKKEFAGKPDWFFSGGVLVDVKSGKRFADLTNIQLAAYKKLIEANGYGTVNTCIEVLINADIDMAYRVVSDRDLKLAWRQFNSLMAGLRYWR